MSDTLERPAWATETEYDGGSPYVHRGVIFTGPPVDGVENVGTGWPDGEARYELLQGAEATDVPRLCDPYGLDFTTPEDVRAYAHQLLAAAAEWERIANPTVVDIIKEAHRRGVQASEVMAEFEAGLK